MIAKKFVWLLVVGALVASVPASASVILDFESLNQPGGGFNDVGTIYIEDGFQLTSGFFGFRSPQTGNALYWAGSTALFDDTPNGTITLSKVGGGTFRLSSIDFTEVDTNRLGPTSVNLIGNLSGGGTVMAALSLDGVFGFETLTFSPMWTGLTSVTWQQTPLFHQFDNITIDAAEPTTLLLLGLGLAALGSRRRNAA